VTLEADGANTDQALDAIPVKPIKNPTEAADKFAEPITPTTSQGGSLEAGINDTTSLRALEEEIHNLQTRAGSADEVWQSQRNPGSDQAPHSPTPGSSSKQLVEALIENLGKHKRTRGSDDEHPRLTTLLIDAMTPGPAKENGGFAGEYVKPATSRTHQDVFAASGSRNAASLTTNEAEKSVLTNVSFSPVAQTPHGYHPRTAEAHDSDSLTGLLPKSARQQDVYTSRKRDICCYVTTRDFLSLSRL